MKPLIFAAILMTLTPGIRSQDLQNLDRKFGIKNLRLETDISLYRSRIKYQWKEKDGQVYYKYTGTDMENILGIPVQEVGIIFYKNKLSTISIIFKKVTDIDEKQAYSKLSDLFGKGHEETQTGNNTLNYIWGYSWETDKIFMQLSRYNDNAEMNPGQMDLFMYSQKIHTQMNTDNF